MFILHSGVPRDQIFVTTKLFDHDQGFDSAIAACELSLEKLGLDYIGESDFQRTGVGTSKMKPRHPELT